MSDDEREATRQQIADTIRTALSGFIGKRYTGRPKIGIDLDAVMTSTIPDGGLGEFGIEVRPFVVQVRRVWLEPFYYSGGRRVLVELLVPDRDTGEPLVITFKTASFIQDGLAPDAAALIMREALAEVMIHEMCEHLYLHGQRVFDPHAPVLDSVMLATSVVP